MPESDNFLLKFHGTYMQDNRDLRDERARQRLEPAFDFMVRIRAAGGIVTPQQWLQLDALAHKYANGEIRLTTRQSFQFHGVLKWNLRQTIHDINQTLLDTLAACGDVNRNVMCNPNPYQSEVHGEVYEWAKRLSLHLAPRTRAYHEIWLGEEAVVPPPQDEEPMYGPTYLPRKFKIAIAVPPSNDVDVTAHDVGLIAIVDGGRLAGFNVSVGGGLGMTHGEPATFPNLGWVIGFCRPEQVLDVAEKILTTQRDFGDRSNRKHARLKYTILDRGVEWFKDELQRRLGWQLEPERPFHFEHHGDRYGWVKGTNGKWHLTLFIENGRIRDWEDYPLMTGLRTIAQSHDGDFRLTANQNLILGERFRREPAADRATGAVVQAQRRPAGFRPAAERHGLRGPADLRAGDGRVGALPARADHQAGGPAGRGGAGRRRDRDPHDRLPQRLRPAVSGRDRLGGQGLGQVQPVPGGRLHRHAAEPSLSRKHRRGGDSRHAQADLPALRPGAAAGRAFWRFRRAGRVRAGRGRRADFIAGVRANVSRCDGPDFRRIIPSCKGAAVQLNI